MHLPFMTVRLLFFVILISCISVRTFSQVFTSEQTLTGYCLKLKNIKTDSIIVLRRGCIGCARYYDSTSLSTEKGELIYVLSMHNGKSKIAFIDRYLIKERSVSSRRIFRFIRDNHWKLKTNKKTQSLIPVKTDSLIPYMFESIEIRLPSLYRQFTIIKNQYLAEGSFISNKEVTRLISQLIVMIDTLLQSIPPDPEE